jgi:hypothetical protein
MSEEKYGITDAHYLCDSAIFNTETNELLRFIQICDLLNEQDQKIKELEHRLANCIEPKFKIGQEVWYKPSFTLYSAKIESIKVHYRTSGKVQIQYVITAPNGFKNHKNEKDLFATKEDVKSKLIGVK